MDDVQVFSRDHALEPHVLQTATLEMARKVSLLGLRQNYLTSVRHDGNLITAVGAAINHTTFGIASQ